MADLERCLREAEGKGCRRKLIATDGVFSMDGHVADLKAICALADRYQALVMVDDCHATGFVGPTGRGTAELHGVMGRVDIITGTLGKALGGASGGFVAARRPIVELLRQRWARHRRMPSMIEAWLSASEMIASCSPSSGSNTPPLASKQAA